LALIYAKIDKKNAYFNILEVISIIFFNLI